MLSPLPSQAVSLPNPADVPALMGCDATVYSIDSDEPNGGYNPWSNDIVLLGLDRLPREWGVFIAAHEAGHCLQFRGGGGWYRPSEWPEFEWEADLHAIRFLERYGIDGAAVNAHIWGYINRTYGYEGRPNSPHGIVKHRILRGYLNRTLVHVEAP